MLMARAGVAAIVVLSLAATARAQDAVARSAAADVLEPAARGIVVDVSRLPLSLVRIHRGLQQASVREERDGLNLRYIVEVFGEAPPLVVFTREDNLVWGPVPWGAPTHREIVEQITPREYRSPAIDLSALFRWLAERANK